MTVVELLKLRLRDNVEKIERFLNEKNTLQRHIDEFTSEIVKTQVESAEIETAIKKLEASSQ